MATRRTSFGKDTGLQARMVLTMFLLGLVYVVFIGVLFAVGAGAGLIVVVAVVLLLLQLFASDKIAMASMGVKEVSPADEPELHGIIERLCVQADLPKPRVADGAMHATLLYVDSFGNIALNLTRDDVEGIGIVSGTRVELEHAGERYYAVMARTFADARAGDVILYEDSYRNVSVAISRGSAARMLHASPGQVIRITPV